MLAVAMSTSVGAIGFGQAAEDDEEIFELSPFEVSSSENDIGYYSERTLAGSRLNSKVADLAASITVVTEQQLEDTAATDINDVFLYEASTEGFGNFTPTTGSLNDRGTIKDAGAGYSFANTGESRTASTSQRVRGLAAPTTSQNYYPTLAAIPFDSYNTRTIEINRGPNSILSGLGSPAGIVNQSTATALLDHESTELQFRIDDRGGWRGSFSHNQPIIDDTLSIYVAGLREEQEFERKPSYDDTSRVYTAIRYQPWEKTTIRGSYEIYENENRRPNSLTPRDFVTPWFEAGRPAYDPTTRMVTVLDTGEVRGPFDVSANSPTYQEGDKLFGAAFWDETSRHYTPGIVDSDARVGRPVIMVGQDGYIATEKRTDYGDGSANYPVSMAAPAQEDLTAEQWEVYSQLWTQSDFYNWQTDTISNFIAPPVTDQSIYNWEEYNVLAMNYGSAEAETYNLELEQEILPNLFGQIGWFRQNYDNVQNYTVQQQTGATMYINTNLKLPNGEPNPYFGLPYLEDYLPDTWTNHASNDNLRAQLAYELDFTDSDGWTRWLGEHRFLGLWSKQEEKSLSLRLRGTYVGGDPRFLPWNDLDTTGAWRYYGNSDRIRRNYYLANPGDAQGVVTAGSPTHWGQPPYTILDGEVVQDFGGPQTGDVWAYNWETESWETAPATWGTVLHDATSGRNERELESTTFGWQGYFLDNRIITTVGVREDTLDVANTVGSAGLGREEFTERGYVIPSQSYNRWSYTNADGEQVFNEDRITGDTTSVGVVAVPFRWEGGDFRVHYNESDNFNPPDSAQTDVFGELLPKPTGSGKDYGFSVSAFDNKLLAKFNWFENSAENERTGAAGTLIDRLTRIEHRYLRPWAETIAHFQLGYYDYATDEGTRPPLSTEQQNNVEARVEEIMGLRYDWPAGLNFGATQTTLSEGMEVQLIYNPIQNWNIKLTAAQNETTTANVAPQYDAWRDLRLPFWQDLTSPLTSADDPNHDGDNNPNTFMYNGVRPADITNFWSAYGYVGDFDIENPSSQWYDVSEFFDSAVQSQVALAKAQEGVPTPNLREWRANLISNYLFTDGSFKGLGVGGSLRWESEAAIGYYGYAADPDRPTYLNAPDPDRPYFDDGVVNLDLWLSYRRPIQLFGEDIDWKIQLNIRNAQEDGELRPISVDYAGNIQAYRIIDPRQFFLTNTFSF